MTRLFLVCFVIFSMQHCKEKKNAPQRHPLPAKKPSKYVHSIRIKSPLKNAVIPKGKDFAIEFAVKKKFPDVDSTQIYLGSKKIGTLYGKKLGYNWKLKENKMGKKLLKIRCFHQNGKVGIASRTIICVPAKSPQLIHYKKINGYRHDRKAFTQGLVYDRGFLYEGTGQYGKSEIRKLKISSGEVLQRRSLAKSYFGEGITIIGEKLYQLTWISGKGFIYDKQSFNRVAEFSISAFSSQGWGLTHVEDTLILSNGTHQLYFLSAKDFTLLKRLEVCDNKGIVSKLNELEYIEGYIFANVWLSDTLAVIDPKSGSIVGKVDCTNLLNPAEKKRLNLPEDVLNGIAYNPTTKHLYLTGKNWPKVFEIKLKN